MIGDDRLMIIDEEHCQKKVQYTIEEHLPIDDDQVMIMEYIIKILGIPLVKMIYKNY